jgi:hypothetical protein
MTGVTKAGSRYLQTFETTDDNQSFSYFPLLAISSAMFDCQAEMASLAAAPKVARVATQTPSSALQVVSFAQTLT